MKSVGFWSIGAGQITPPRASRLAGISVIKDPVNDFLQTALGFPTVFYSVLLGVSVLYWLLASTGLADGDSVDALLGAEGDAGELSGAAAMLSKLGLAGVPVMVVLTVLSFTGWIGTYFVQLLALRHLHDSVRLVAGAGVLVAMLVPSLAVTTLVLRPLSRALARLRPADDAPALLGRTGVVVSATVADDYGHVSVDDGGAGLILRVRHDVPHQLKRGDHVVLIEYLDGQNAYRVLSEQQFLSQ